MAPPEQGDGEGGGGREGGGGFGQKISGIIRIAVFWYFASKLFSSKKGPSSSTPMASFSNNLFQKSEPMDLWVYVTENGTHFSEFADESALVWQQSNIPYATWSPEGRRSVSLKYQIPAAVVERNASLFAHVFMSRSGYPADPSDPEYLRVAAFHEVHPVVTYFRKTKADKKRSLLKEAESDANSKADGSELESESGESSESSEWVAYWKPNVTINLVDDFTAYPSGAVPPNIAPYLKVEAETGDYYPLVFFNEFWLLRDKLVEVNRSSVAEGVELHLEVGPIGMTKWQLMLQMEQSFQMQRSYGSMVEGEAEQLKRVLLEGNPYLLAVTMLVSLLHSVFDFLAFKNDIQFWSKNQSMEGLSAKSVVVSFASQLIVLLYLIDNDTSWMILASSAVGCCIEFWKMGKAMHIDIDRSGRVPLLRFRDKESYTANKTKEYDDMAMKYLSYALFFLVACSAAYTLVYERHKSWYSWVLSSLTTCVYMFGFIMMCPQLFINYKLKSVAHLPWRQMTYKFLNTIIDDLFAFVIKMPTLHRLSVFRDDLIFLIMIYQRWIYPVDKKRVNEFGFGGTDDNDQQLLDQPPSDQDNKKTN